MALGSNEVNIIVKAKDEASAKLKAIQKTAQGLAKVGFAAAAVGAAGLAVRLKGAVDAASNLNETVNKSSVVFGANAKIVQDFAEKSAETFGGQRGGGIE